MKKHNSLYTARQILAYQSEKILLGILCKVHKYSGSIQIIIYDFRSFDTQFLINHKVDNCHETHNHKIGKPRKLHLVDSLEVDC